MAYIIFSRKFLKNHPRKGDPTFFVEKIWKGIETGNPNDGVYSIYAKEPRLMSDGSWQIPHLWRDQMNDDSFQIKYHTIRPGNKWKVGDKFSPRVWSGEPYKTKQIIIAPDIEVKKTWDFEMKPKIWIDECEFYINGNMCKKETLEVLAKNDGLSLIDFINWIGGGYMLASSKRKPFVGQIICWNDKIEY